MDLWNLFIHNIILKNISTCWTLQNRWDIGLEGGFEERGYAKWKRVLYSVQLSSFPEIPFPAVLLKTRGISYSSLRQHRSIKNNNNKYLLNISTWIPTGTSNSASPRHNFSFPQNLCLSFTQAQARNLGFFPSTPGSVTSIHNQP